MKMKYTEQAVETLDDAGSVIANKNIEIEQLRQRVAELEKERDEWRSKHDVACLTITNLQSKYECQLSATSKAMQGVAELTAERDALKQQRDELLAAAEQVCHANNLTEAQIAVRVLNTAIASVKGQP